MGRYVTAHGTRQATVQKYWHGLLKKAKSGVPVPNTSLAHRLHFDETKKVYGAFDRKEDGISKKIVTSKFFVSPSKCEATLQQSGTRSLQ